MLPWEGKVVGEEGGIVIDIEVNPALSREALNISRAISSSSSFGSSSEKSCLRWLLS